MGHISPEAASGGPLTLVRDGDEITVDVLSKSLTLHVDDDTLQKRREARVYTPRPGVGGYLARYASAVTSAAQGAVLEVPR